MLTSNFPRWQGDTVTPFVLHLAEDLAALGWEVDVLAPHALGAAKSEDFNAVQVARFQYWWPAKSQQLCYNGGALANLRSRPLARFQLLPFALAETWATLRNLRKHQYDLVHSHWILPQGLVGWFATKIFRIPNVITVHGGDIFGLQGKWLGQAKRFALSRATRITVNSSFTEAAVRAILNSETRSIEKIPMGVAENSKPSFKRRQAIRSHFPTGELLLAFVGRLVPEKGASDVIEAIGILERKKFHCDLIIIGDGPSRAELEQLARSLGVANRVHFLGWLASDEVAEHLSVADAFVGPSRRSPEGWVEAQGLTFAEAMMAGIPVIATRSGGIRDTVQHEQTGLLVEENSPDQIAEAIVRLSRDPAFAKRMASSGRDFAREFRSRPASAREFDALFMRLLADTRGPETGRILE